MQGKKAIISLSGNLAYFNIYDILMLLHLGRKSGVLFLEKGQNRIHIFLHHGLIVFTQSNDYRDSLAKYMLDNNLVTKKLLEKGLEAMDKFPDKYKTTWDILVEKKVLKERDLKIAAEYSYSHIIYSLFRWKEGTFKFSTSGQLPEHANIVSIDPQSLIMEGVRMSDEWEEIHKNSPKEDIILQVNPDIDPNNKELDLTDIEWKILGKVNGHRTVVNICKEIRFLNEYETLKVLTDLHKKKIVLPVESNPDDEDPMESTATNINIFTLETLDEEPSFEKEPDKESAPKIEPMKKQSIGHTVIRGKIVITEKGIKKKTLIVTGEPLTIGSSKECDVPIKSKKEKVPLKYATIYLDGMSYFIQSHTDKNILINNQEYQQKELERFDEIQIGEISLIFS